MIRQSACIFITTFNTATSVLVVSLSLCHSCILKSIIFFDRFMNRYVLELYNYSETHIDCFLKRIVSLNFVFFVLCLYCVRGFWVNFYRSHLYIFESSLNFSLNYVRTSCLVKKLYLMINLQF